ncbi:MAG: hypothetical protein K6T16_01970, partial [Candidatus Pacearchaeota archaeon]|nr:hypothetical protein [Candidatus Pacearchaeota archaeon]
KMEDYLYIEDVEGIKNKVEAALHSIRYFYGGKDALFDVTNYTFGDLSVDFVESRARIGARATEAKLIISSDDEARCKTGLSELVESLHLQNIRIIQ